MSAPSRINLKAAKRAEARILRGDTLHMGFAEGAVHWWFENPFEQFETAEIRSVMVGPNGSPRLTEAGDSLFGWNDNSQTWRSDYGAAE